MALFRRRRGAPHPADRVARFWSWWRNAHTDVATAFDLGQPQRVRRLVEPWVLHCHPDLVWRIGPGGDARYRLVLSGGGRPALRTLTQRWLDLAGDGGAGPWEYHPAFPPEPERFGEPMQVGGLSIDPLEAVTATSLDADRCRLDLTVHHPVFDRIGEAARARTAATLVRWVLGEDGTDRWIGSIASSSTRPADDVPVPRLAVLADELAERFAECWTSLEGTSGRSRLIATVRHPLHRVDHPLLDQHLAVRLPYLDALPDGLPTPPALAELEAFEQDLTTQVGDRALLVARQTAGGERVLHLYADGAAGVPSLVHELLDGYLGPLATMDVEADPEWRRIEHLRA